MQLRFILVADAASVSIEGKLTVAGIFDIVSAPTVPVVWPLLNVVARFEGTPQEAMQHRIRVRLTNAIGQPLFDTGDLLLQFSGGDAQTPTRADAILPITGLLFPAFGNYAFEVMLEGLSYGLTPFYVRQLPQGG